MAARDMEAAQKALRRTDYEDDNEDDDDSSEDEGEMMIHFSSTGSVSSSTASTSEDVVVAVEPRRGVTPSSDHPLAPLTLSSSPSAFDPYSPTAANANNSRPEETALFDEGSVHTVASETTEVSINNNNNTANAYNAVVRHHHPTMTTSVPGGAGYLEMEEEPPRNNTYSGSSNHNNISSSSSSSSSNEPITTSSGLMLTHRRSSPMARRTVPVPEPSSSLSSVTTSRVTQKNGMNTIFDKSDPLTRNNNNNTNSTGFRNVQRDYFEVEHGFFGWKSATENDNNDDDESYLHGNSRRGRHSMPMLQARRFLSFVRIWMVISAAFLVLATGVLLHSFGHHSSSDTMAAGAEAETVTFKDGTTTTSSATYNNGVSVSGASGTQQYQQGVVNLGGGGGTNQIILVPMENISDRSHRQQYVVQQPQQQQQQQQQQQYQQYQVPPQQRQLGFHIHNDQSESTSHKHQHSSHHGVRRVLLELRQEFEGWAVHHGKKYRSAKEKEHRFHIWSENQKRTLEKNQRHGPCKYTNQAVFGSTPFQDVSPEEFKAQYLTGYNPPKEDELDAKHRQMKNPRMRNLGRQAVPTLKPGLQNSKMHESIKQRMLQEHGDRILQKQQQQQMTNSNSYGMRKASCNWYDVACMLRWLWNEAGITFGSIVGTMEPKYDANAFPIAVDWRDYGIVTDVRSQGNCGACWAITAVETVESAYALATGKLYDLSEAEIIACDESCEMCSGGWPQNAFDYVMKHGGLPLYNNFGYDGDTLLSLTEGVEGTSSYWTEDSVKEYRQQVCPAEDGGGNSHDSGDSSSYWQDGGENENYSDNSNQGRYGNIKGYGYATDRCICYSDGSGCDCSNQDEELAVANIASHGPAVVCVDAALWQDYSGGIMTSDIGCGSAFLDVNHCVQVVGYAFTDGSNGDDQGDGGGEEEDEHGGSGSQDNQSSSGQREGYWIVRNQWGGYWGMNGFAYVAMGENTCGILNDMTQAYL